MRSSKCYRTTSHSAKPSSSPPDTSIWQDRARGGWCGHFTSCKRISESFDRHGGDSKSALKELLRRLWG